MAINRNKVLKKAQKFVQQGKLAKAISEYQLLADDDPSDVRVLLKVGDLYSKIGDIESALETYRKVAEHYARDGFFLKAVAVYKQMLKLDPSAIEIYNRLAELYTQLGLNNEAMKQYQIVARHYETKGMKKESLDVFKKMAEMDPDNIASRVKLAELYVREGHGDQAIDDFMAIAAELKKQGNTDDLIKVYEKIVKLKPESLDLFRELAGLYLEAAEPKRALAKLQVCFKQDPKNVQTLELLGRAFSDLQQPEKAQAVMAELEAVKNNGGGAAQPTAQPSPQKSAAKSDTIEKSQVAQPRAAGPLAPSEVEKLKTDVEVYLRYGLADKAATALENALKQSPEVIELRNLLREVFLKNGDETKAANVLYDLSQIAENQGNRIVAKSILDEVLAIDSEHALATRDLERLQEDLGEAAFTAASGESDVEAIAEEFVDDSVAEPVDADMMEVVDDLPIVEDVVLEEVSDSQVSEVLAEPFEQAEVVEDMPAIELDEVIEDVVEVSDPVMKVDGSAVDLAEMEADMLRPDNDEELAAQKRAEESQIHYKSIDSDSESVVLDQAESAQEFEMEIELSADDSSLVIDAPVAEAAPELDLSADMSIDLSSDLENSNALGADLFADVAPDTEEAAAPLDVFSSISIDEDVSSSLEPESVEPPQPATPEPAQAAAASGDFTEELQEAEFFIGQGLEEEATSILKDIIAKDANCTKAKQLMSKLAGNKPVQVRVPAASKNLLQDAASELASEAKQEKTTFDFGNEMERSESGGLDMFDLAEALKEEIADFNEPQMAEAASDEPPTFDEVFSAFKKGIKEALDDDDGQAHYDLGIAYKEMGLLDDAVSEFEIAGRDPALRFEAFAMVGYCCVEKNSPAEALMFFKEALAQLKEGDERQLGLKYDLADAYDKANRPEDALVLFKDVYKHDQSFREISHRMKDLAERIEGTVPVDDEHGLHVVDEGDNVNSQTKKKKTKISYL